MFGFLKSKKQIEREINEHACSIEKLMSYHGRLLESSSPESDHLVFVKLWAAKALQYQIYQNSHKLAKKLASQSDDPDDYLTEMTSDAFDIYSIQTMYGVESARENCIEVYFMRHGGNAEKHLKQDFVKVVNLIKHEFNLK